MGKSKRREDTFDVAVGVGRLRWGDRPQDATSQYPDSMIMGGTGVNPLTGAPIPIRPGVMIMDFATVAGVGFAALAEFKDDKLECVELVPGAERVSASVVRALCSLLEVKDTDGRANRKQQGPRQKTWDVGGRRGGLKHAPGGGEPRPPIRPLS